MTSSPSFREVTVVDWLEAVAAPEPAPGGGAATAVTVGLGAALVAMAARFSRANAEDADRVAVRSDALRERALALADEDAVAYRAVLEAYRLPKGGAGRRDEIRHALERACEVPLQIAEIAAEVAALGADIGARGNPNLAGDAATAVHLAVAATRSATQLAIINADLGDLGPEPIERAHGMVAAAEAAAGRMAGDR